MPNHQKNYILSLQLTADSQKLLFLRGFDYFWGKTFYHYHYEINKKRTSKFKDSIFIYKSTPPPPLHTIFILDFCSIKNLHWERFERTVYQVTNPRSINSATFLTVVAKQISFFSYGKFTQLKAIFRWKGNLPLLKRKINLSK